MAELGFSLILLAISVLIPAFPILKAWLYDGEMESLPAIGFLLAIFCGMGILWQTHNDAVVLAGTVVFTAAAFGMPFLFARVEKQAHEQLTDDDISKFQRAIAFDENNASAHGLLAEKYLECGRLEEAIDEFRIGIRLQPYGPHASRWKSKLRGALEEQERRALAAARSGKGPPAQIQ